MFQRVLLAFVACFLACSSALAAPVHVRDFSVVADIARNGDITVTEKLLVEIPDKGDFHGIFRDIPVVTRWREQGRAKMDVLHVALNGKARPVDDVERTPSGMRVYQRDKEHRLPPGLHRFELSYRMTGQVGLFEKNDELTWNVTGSGWEAPIDRASCTVLCPEGAPFYGQKAWLGRAGSRESAVVLKRERQDGREVLFFTAKRPVMPGEDFTVAAGWGKGVIALDAAPEEDTLLLPLVILFGVASALSALLWFLLGRDPARGVVFPRFHAPVGTFGVVSPAAAGYVSHGGVLNSRAMGAAFLSLASQGGCRIEGHARQGFMLWQGDKASVFPEEEILRRMIPQQGLKVDRENGELLYDMRAALSRELRRGYGKMWKSRKGFLAIGVLLVACVLALEFLIGRETGGMMPEGLPALAVMGAAAGILVTSLLRIVRSLWKRRRFAPILFCFVFFAVLIFILSQAGRNALDEVLLWFSPAHLLLMAGTILVPLGFGAFMDAPTREGRSLLDAIEGLALYIGTAETGRLNAMNPPDQTLQHYQELLPYAVALDLEQAWGSRFSEVLSGQLMTAGAAVLEPSFADSFSSDIGESVSSYSAASSESSFGGGGGGGAGSGGGGGGGGGC